MAKDVDPEVPVGALGTIIRQDGEDTDVYTYEVQWDNGKHDIGVREYNMEPAPEPPAGPPQLVASIHRMAAHLRTAEEGVASWLAKFQTELMPVLKHLTWHNPETGDVFIIPDSTEQYNKLLADLHAFHTELRKYDSDPAAIAAIQDIETYNKDLVTEDTTKENLVKLTDEQPTAQEAGPSATDMIKSLPDAEKETDALLEKWQSASEADRPAIEQRIKRLHDRIQKSFLLH